MAYLDTTRAAKPVSKSVPNAHLYDQVTSDIANYIEQESSILAASMIEHGRAPFAAKLTREEQERVYYEKYADYVYNPDGTPNEDGRKRLEAAFGPDAFSEIVRIVIRGKRREGVIGPPMEYPIFGDQPPTPLDTGQLGGLAPAPMPLQEIGAPAA